jgi:hypothetical protein
MSLIKIDADSFHTSVGLQPLIKVFETAGLSVARVSGDAKPKRLVGILTKTTTIIFESGQKLEMKLNYNYGNIYSWKLNGKILAIKNYKILDEAVKEVVAFVRENQPNYLKQKEITALKNQRVTIPKPRPVNTTVAEQIREQETNLANLSSETGVIKGHLRDMNLIIAQKQAALDDLTAKIAAENARSLTLEADLKKAAGASR